MQLQLLHVISLNSYLQVPFFHFPFFFLLPLFCSFYYLAPFQPCERRVVIDNKQQQKRNINITKKKDTLTKHI